MDNVKNGTRADGPALCNTCRRGTVMRGAAESAEQIYCSEIGRFIRLRVVECSSYENKTAPTLHQLSQMAWILTTKKHTREIGFVRSRDFRETYKEEILPSEYDPY